MLFVCMRDPIFVFRHVLFKYVSFENSKSDIYTTIRSHFGSQASVSGTSVDISRRRSSEVMVDPVSGMTPAEHEELKYCGDFGTFKEFCFAYYGKDLTDTEMHTKLDELYLINAEFELHLVNQQGLWMAKRGRGNEMRGSAAVRLSRKRSLETVGMILGIRLPPWTIEPVEGENKEEIMH